MQHFLNNLVRVALWERAQRIRYKVYRNNIIRVAHGSERSVSETRYISASSGIGLNKKKCWQIIHA